MLWILIICALFAVHSSVGQQTCPPGYGVSRAIGDKCYKVNWKLPSDRKNWFDAENDCKKDGGHLVSIPDAFQKTIVNTIVNTAVGSPPAGRFWLGASNFINQNQYTWSDGTPFVYSYWQGNQQPNIAGSNCVVSSLGTGVDQWTVLPCDFTNPYVCETIPKNTTCPGSGDWRYNVATNACYQIFLNPAPWAQAQYVCSVQQQQSMLPQGNLASIHSEQENAFIADLVVAASTGSYPPICNGSIGWYWLGFQETYDTPNPGVNYQWNDNTPFNVKKTVVDVVNAANTPLCGQMTASFCHVDANNQVIPGEWNAYNCLTPLPYVCKVLLYTPTTTTSTTTTTPTTTTTTDLPTTTTTDLTTTTTTDTTTSTTTDTTTSTTTTAGGP